MSLNNYLKVHLIKPHGSVNWLLHRREADPGVYTRGSFDLPGLLSLASSRIFNGDALNFGNVQVLYPSDPELSDVEKMHKFRFGNQYFYPLILLPLTVKQYDFLDGFNERIISEGKKILSTASEIYLIGYRAADDVIKEMFKEVRARAILHVISLADSEEIMNRVLDWYPGTLSGTASSRGFWDFLESF